jgi:hypothetical protein
MSDPLSARFAALVATLKALPVNPASSGGGYVENFVLQADVWRIADEIATLLREPPEAATVDARAAPLLFAAQLALRSYQYGNGAPDLAKEIADAIEASGLIRAAAPELNGPAGGARKDVRDSDPSKAPALSRVAAPEGPR